MKKPVTSTQQKNIRCLTSAKISHYPPAQSALQVRCPINQPCTKLIHILNIQYSVHSAHTVQSWGHTCITYCETCIPFEDCCISLANRRAWFHFYEGRVSIPSVPFITGFYIHSSIGWETTGTKSPNYASADRIFVKKTILWASFISYYFTCFFLYGDVLGSVPGTYFANYGDIHIKISSSCTEHGKVYKFPKQECLEMWTKPVNFCN